jgi:hypothetical protein
MLHRAVLLNPTFQSNGRPILMIEAIRSSERLVLARAALRNIPEDGILHTYRSHLITFFLTSVLYIFSFISFYPFLSLHLLFFSVQCYI